MMKIQGKKKTFLLFIAGYAIVFAMMFIGIREDYMILETAALCGGGCILLLLRRPAWIIYLMIFYCCVEKWMISQFGMPDSLDLAMDLMMLLCLGLALKTLFEKNDRYYFVFPLVLAGAFFVIGMLSALFQQVDILLICWSYRNLMRFFLFFFSCVVILDVDDVENLMRLFSWLFHANILIVSFQFWIQGYSQDNLGGLFGTQMGCNGYMNTYLCIYVSFVCVMYMARRLSFWIFLYVSAGSLYIAALSELKFWFMEYVLILAVSILLTRFSSRTILMLIGAAAGLFIGLQLFNAVFPGWEFSVNQILDYTGQGGYSTETDLNRLTAISRICNEFLHTISQRLFGFGLGSCETSTFFNSGFFQQYGETIHYTYLLQAFLFLETGFVGLFLYLGFYISISAKALIMRRFLDETAQIYCGTAAICAVTCILQVFYNSALRVENSGYLAYFMLAVPFIFMKGRSGEENDESIKKD
ncbi:hypothetical protein [Faecalicatena fissicatena]|uniref:Lipid A core-O-antigen ligase and related enzymes n=1 Tax=Faecalicatena fissicatena TaxID=290055 RepID=A0ABS2E4H3_9FIRM|nr:hypothetical protein [Faecalicatena fissicatena]MBM6736532.1 hypothetical protein [Faecalicatena fissicatena]